VTRNGTDDVMITVNVSDTGSGIDDDEMERIFDVFEQAQQGLKSGKGAGLGLPLSRRYAKALGGDVTVTSSLGEGSHFRFTFAARVETGDVAPALAQRNVLRLAADQESCRVLVVDDELENREMLAAMLTAVGLRVETTGTAQDALLRLRQAGMVDLVLMDKCLPGLDGYEVCRRFKADDNLRTIPILFVSALSAVEDIAAGFEHGAVDYIAKPCRKPEVLARVRTHLELRDAYVEHAREHARLTVLERHRDMLIHMVVHDMRSGKNKARTARDIGIAERTVYNLLARYGIK